MLLSRFNLESGSNITPLFSFLVYGTWFTVYKSLPLCTLSLLKSFNKFVQSVVDARREGDEILLSSVVIEIMKILGTSSNGYQIIVRSRHSITKYLNGVKTQKAINEPLFKRLNLVQKHL